MAIVQVVPGGAQVLAMVLLLSGCGLTASHTYGNELNLDDYWITRDLMIRGGVISVGAEFRSDVDPDTFMEMALWYLRHKPEAVIGGDDATHADHPSWPRARDMLAAWVACKRDLDFMNTPGEGDAERDLKIKALVEAIAEQEAAKQGKAGSASTSPSLRQLK